MREVSCVRIIQIGFIVTLILGEFLPIDITVRVTVTPSAAAGSQFFPKRQLEDAATPHLTHPRVLYLVFKEPAAVAFSS